MMTFAPAAFWKQILQDRKYTQTIVQTIVWENSKLKIGTCVAGI